jgi:hypothetical protein
MNRRRLAVVVLVFVFSVITVRYVWRKQAAQKRETTYQLALAKCSKEFGPGTSRKNVEDYLHGNGTEFGQLCCIERRDSYTAYADLIRIGKEGAPWYCSQTTVSVALEFVANEPKQLVEANPSDTLKKVSIFRQLEGCL